MVVSRSVRFDESVADTVDVDTDSETDEEVQTVPATEMKSVPVLARPQMTLELLATHQTMKTLTVQSLFRNLTTLSRRQQCWKLQE